MKRLLFALFLIITSSNIVFSASCVDPLKQHVVFIDGEFTQCIGHLNKNNEIHVFCLGSR